MHISSFQLKQIPNLQNHLSIKLYSYQASCINQKLPRQKKSNKTDRQPAHTKIPTHCENKINPNIPFGSFTVSHSITRKIKGKVGGSHQDLY